VRPFLTIVPSVLRFSRYARNISAFSQAEDLTLNGPDIGFRWRGRRANVGPSTIARKSESRVNYSSPFVGRALVPDNTCLEPGHESPPYVGRLVFRVKRACSVFILEKANQSQGWDAKPRASRNWLVAWPPKGCWLSLVRITRCLHPVLVRTTKRSVFRANARLISQLQMFFGRP
jgi:hypothetical protein